MDFYVNYGMRIMGQNTRQLRLGIPVVYQMAAIPETYMLSAVIFRVI